MVDSPWTFLLLVLAGVLSGIIGTVAGLASLVSYPALLSAGLSPVAANVTNTVALIGNGVGSTLGSRPELTGQAGRVRAFAGMMVLGGALGAGLVLVLPADGFTFVVPWLIAGASVVVLVRHRLQRISAAEAVSPRPPARRGEPQWWVTRIGLFLVAVYAGYFGAGAAVMALVLMSMITHDHLLRVNALKSVLFFFANLVAAIGFAIFGPVHWLHALGLGIGCIVGGYLGPAVARRLPVAALSYLVAFGGFVLAVRLGISAYA